MEQDDNFESVKSGIEDIVAKAQSVIMPKIAPVTKVLDDIKVQLAHGTDRIPTSQIQEWAVALSVITTELTPFREAYALTSGLWKIDIKKSSATNIVERRQVKKKAEIEVENVLVNGDKETQKLIIDYMSSMIQGAQENIYQMCSELNRIMDARTRNQEVK